MWLLFRALPLLGQIGTVLAIVGVVSGSIWGYGLHKYNEGWRSAKADTAKQDQEAVDAADEGSARRRNCVAAGRVWSVETGKCSGG